MAMMMKKWWLASKQSNKHTVKVDQLKLELGLFGANVATTVNDKLAIEITWIKKCNENSSSSSSFSCMVPFHRTLKPPCSHITPCRRFIAAGKTPSHVWDNHDLCVFNLGLKDVCYVTFNVLYGQGGGEESKGKMVVVGKVCMTLAMEEMKTESNVQRKLPIRLKVNGLIIEATLLVKRYCIGGCLGRSIQMALVSNKMALISNKMTLIFVLISTEVHNWIHRLLGLFSLYYHGLALFRKKEYEILW